MGMFKKLLLHISVFFLLVVTFPFGGPLSPSALAEEKQAEFSTTYDVLYDVAEDGITTVTEKITLKNLTSEYFAKEFKLTIGATQISDILASDPSGSLDVQSEQKDSATIISVKFNQQVAGLGKALPWSLQFKSKDFAEKTGKVWEVRAPKVSSSVNLEGYNLTISVPASFGEPTLISPTPKTQTVSQGKLFLTFDKEQLKESGVSASFGNYQLFDFDLKYHLKNDNLITILTNIALPPDTFYQDVVFYLIEPKPINVTADDDGNYLAWYRLNRGQKTDIRVLGSAKLYTKPKVKNPALSADLRKKYTSSQKYWEKDNPQIVSQLSQILGPEPKTKEETVKLIYRFVVNNLKYDQARLKGNIERYGAVTALNNAEGAVCMEFTDLFIALARAAEIPARELDGYAHTANPKLRPLSLTKDILHAWPEYWDEKLGWVMVDPTWENTTGGVDYFSKLDLNHFVFAIKGMSSTQPVPAGSYKFDGEDSQDVSVQLTEQDFLGKPQLTLTAEVREPILAGLPAKILVKISNVGNSILPQSSIKLQSNKLIILDNEGKRVGPLPAFGSADFEFNIRTKSFFESFDEQINILVGPQKFTKDVKVASIFVLGNIPLLLIGSLFLMMAIYGVVLGILIYRKRFLKHDS
ncbi:hypothetical protein A3B45_03175 [Candidatus Daviesbacteria bacterium RIFCSPLOWO2_01_FULL_39_12]|uniref:Transglutaminase-like domain-containing protein n=1 Tax=Candidatus Daviesbacteria bacterium RIFCSPLOWO2_01_FULL_39_12 TaxID=1797785 RepID=A0A1F5KT71_9BACT|nr:MAG: hypothetical protein A3D79_01800 [Candidatus Daviesbacteria bacterium RIFCSPHIGHO2_02_FULL_39_8]OGE44020.1 MAG: hypothetical protein A3B45_03175 [Candidatus Daviesbacteria bacterium RIFCSPLOWO2_01_FULL_39_12]